MTCWSATPIRPWSRRSARAGCGSRDRQKTSPSRCQRSRQRPAGPAGLPGAGGRQGPGHWPPRPRSWPGACTATGTSSACTTAWTPAILAAAVGPGRVVAAWPTSTPTNRARRGAARRPGHVPGRRARRPCTERAASSPPTSPEPWSPAHPRLRVRPGPGRGAGRHRVSDLPIAEVLADPRYRPLLLEVARQVLAEAPVPPAPAGGFDPADLPGSLARLAQASRPRPTRTPRSTWTWRCGTARPTCPPSSANAAAPLVRRLVELVRAIEQGRRSCSPSTSTCWPRTSGWSGSAGRSTRSAR